jgi:hypothetical protein
MNKQVAHELINAELRRLRELPYSELAALVGKTETREHVGEDGKSLARTSCRTASCSPRFILLESESVQAARMKRINKKPVRVIATK